MAFDVSDLVQKMIDAASKSLGADWNAVDNYATAQFKQTAATLAQIEEDLASGAITQAQAKNLMDIQKQTAAAVLLTLQTMATAAAQNAINAAIDAAINAIKGTVNATVGFALL